MQGILTNQEEKILKNEEKFVRKCLTLTYIWREAQIYKKQ